MDPSHTELDLIVRIVNQARLLSIREISRYQPGLRRGLEIDIEHRTFPDCRFGALVAWAKDTWLQLNDGEYAPLSKSMEELVIQVLVRLSGKWSDDLEEARLSAWWITHEASTARTADSHSRHARAA